jgi:hypothetical protein
MRNNVICMASAWHCANPLQFGECHPCCNRIGHSVSAEAGMPRRFDATTSLYGRSGERKYLNAAERRRFVKAAQRAPPEVRLFCLVLTWSGGRISEVLALTPGAIDVASGAANLLSEHLDGGDGATVFRHACAMGLEGIGAPICQRYCEGHCRPGCPLLGTMRTRNERRHRAESSRRFAVGHVCPRGPSHWRCNPSPFSALGPSAAITSPARRSPKRRR